MANRHLRAVIRHLTGLVDPSGCDALTDGELLQRFLRRQDKAAFEVLLWRYGPLVWNACRRILPREQDAEDAFQATFLVFVRKARTINQGDSLGGWLYRVAYRIALAGRARTASRKTAPATGDHAGETADPGWYEVGPVLDEEINRLPDKYRRPVVLCYLEGKTTDEAAQDLGCPQGTVKTRLAWARERLRRQLTRRGLVVSTGLVASMLGERLMAGEVPATLMASVWRSGMAQIAGRALTGIPASVLALSQGALKTMFWTKLKLAAAALVTASVVGIGGGWFIQQSFAVRADEEERKGKPDREDREGERPRRDGEPRREDGERPRREGDRPREDGEKPRRDGDRPREDGEKPRRDGDRPREDGEKPRRDGEPRREGERPRRDGEPRREDGERPRRDGERREDERDVLIVKILQDGRSTVFEIAGERVNQEKVSEVLNRQIRNRRIVIRGNREVKYESMGLIIEAARKAGAQRISIEFLLPERERPRDGDRAPDRERPRDGDRPNPERPRDGDRAPDRERPRDGDRAPDRERPRDGDRAPDRERPRDGDRAPDRERPRDGDRPNPERPRDGGERDPVRREQPRENPEARDPAKRPREIAPDRNNGRRNRPSFHGTVKSIDAEEGFITLTVEGDGGFQVNKSYTLAKDTDVTIDGKTGKLSELPEGISVGVYFSRPQRAVVGIKADGPTVAATIRKVDSAKRTVTIRGEAEDRTIQVAKDALVLQTIRRDGEAIPELGLQDLRDGMQVKLKLSIAQNKVLQIEIASR